MTTLLIVLASFTGLFAFGFGLAGVIGLQSYELPEGNQRRLFLVADYFVTGGVLSMMQNIAENWSKRVAERRLVYAGLANGVACVVILWLLHKVS